MTRKEWLVLALLVLAFVVGFAFGIPVGYDLRTGCAQ